MEGPLAARVSEPAVPGSVLRRAGPLALVALLGAVNFAWQLGSSSYFIDEVFSVEHSLPRLSSLFTVVAHTEVNPWTYFVGLHEWLYLTGSQAEWVTRLPSAVAGVMLIVAIWWAARWFLGARGALLAAALCAMSPLVLQYAQQTRVYIFVMLFVTLAVGATTRGVERAHRGLFVAGILSSVLAQWLHYTAALVLLPLCVWVLRSGIPWRWRIAFAGAWMTATVLLVPLAVEQYGYVPNGAVDVGLGPGSLAAVLGTPFDGRFVWLGSAADWLRLAGAVAMLAAWLALAATRSVHGRSLLLVLSAFGPVVLICAAAAGKPILITRYSTVAAPLLLTVLAGAIVVRWRTAGLPLLVLVATLFLIGAIRTRSAPGRWPPAREAVSYIQHHRRPGDAVLPPGDQAVASPVTYYESRLLQPLPPEFAAPGASGAAASLGARRTWIVSEIWKPTSARELRAAAGTAACGLRARLTDVREYEGEIPLALYLTSPVVDERSRTCQRRK